MKRKKSHRNIKTKNEESMDNLPVLKRERLGIWLDGMTKQRLPNKSSKDFSIDLNVEDDYGITAWHCKYDRSEIVKLIIESSTDGDGDTAFQNFLPHHQFRFSRIRVFH